MQESFEVFNTDTTPESEGLQRILRPFQNANSYFNVHEFEKARQYTNEALQIRRTYQLRQYAGILELDAKLTKMGFPSQDQHSVAEGK